MKLIKLKLKKLEKIKVNFKKLKNKVDNAGKRLEKYAKAIKA